MSSYFDVDLDNLVPYIKYQLVTEALSQNNPFRIIWLS